MSDDDLLKRYLLEDLPGAEAEALERRLLEDDDLFERAEAIEGEILEDYANGGLTTTERARVARYLSASPTGRLRLAVIRGLAAISAEEAANGRILVFPPRRPRLSTSELRAAIAAMLVLATGSVWLGVHTSHPPVSEVAPGPVVPALRTFVQVLALSAARGGTAGVQEIRVPAGTDRMELRLLLGDSLADYRSFQVVLRDQMGAEAVDRKDLQPVETPNGKALVVTVDLTRLPAGRYVAEVGGITTGGTVEGVGFPEFQVREPQPGEMIPPRRSP
jgi:hypothetical protein